MKKDKYFYITSVHRDDLGILGFDTSNMDDTTMEELAEKMAEAYVENGFWIDLEIITRDARSIPKRSDHDICDHCGNHENIWRNGSGEIQCDNCGWSETD